MELAIGRLRRLPNGNCASDLRKLCASHAPQLLGLLEDLQHHDARAQGSDGDAPPTCAPRDLKGVAACVAQSMRAGLALARADEEVRSRFRGADAEEWLLREAYAPTTEGAQGLLQYLAAHKVIEEAAPGGGDGGGERWYAVADAAAPAADAEDVRATTHLQVRVHVATGAGACVKCLRGRPLLSHKGWLGGKDCKLGPTAACAPCTDLPPPGCLLALHSVPSHPLTDTISGRWDRRERVSVRCR